MGEAILRLEGVCKSFGGVVTAKQVNLEVQPGEIHGNAAGSVDGLPDRESIPLKGPYYKRSVREMEKREPILKIHSLTKEFPGVKAVSEADLELFGGEVHSIVGGNGAGKSTLMKMLAGYVS